MVVILLMIARTELKENESNPFSGANPRDFVEQRNRVHRQSEYQNNLSGNGDGPAYHDLL